MNTRCLNRRNQPQEALKEISLKAISAPTAASRATKSRRHQLTGSRRRASICREMTRVTLLVCLVASILALVQCASRSGRVKRGLYELPAGAQDIVGPDIRTTFSCEGLGYGYYADTDNACKIFHVCQSFKMSDGSIYNNHWSFMCGNQTVFNQVLLACSHPEDAIPCESSKDFYYINDYFGDLDSPSVKENDLNMAQDLITRAYGSRAPAATV